MNPAHQFKILALCQKWEVKAGKLLAENTPETYAEAIALGKCSLELRLLLSDIRRESGYGS